MGAEEPGLKDSLLPYEAWIQESLRHVVRAALGSVARDGLPGDHHFYLTFRTDHPEVELPARLRAQYPHEMTIVLQHQFDALETDQAGFSVTLYFGGVPARLRIPWGAITQFADPSVRFGLRFEPSVGRQDEPHGEVGEETSAQAADAPEDADRPAQVVSLDAFRKRPPKP
ncbi:SspB family protein [Elioraea thermophila]|uniref:SspB family protein n=1 Tax=Elioraea thermophila TaxID=2185104 RepID=UPI000DF429E3|nr:ClpXP protease specificity-enhancing factor SspB [Elioraea thermophila]